MQSAVPVREWPALFSADPMAAPSREHCFRLMHEMGMMAHIAAHSIRVCQVALALTDCLSVRENGINRCWVMGAALLHDITKTRSFKTGESHAETAAELLASWGYPEVGRIVGQHVRLSAYLETGPLTESEIVNYSDKRVRHDRVVSLDERFDYIVERYAIGPADSERIRSLRQETSLLGQRIFQHLPFEPDALIAHLDPQVYLSDLDAYRAETDMGLVPLRGDEPR